VNCWGVVPAAGVGRRTGLARPKQFVEIAGATLLEHSVRALLADGRVTAVCVVLAPDIQREYPMPWLTAQSRICLAEGGAERSDSVAAGLEQLLAIGAAEEDWVLVHDAARPCLPPSALSALLAAGIEADCGAILAQPVTDTVKRSRDDLVEATLPREALWLAQTPQLFRLGELRAALASARAAGLAVTDEASAIEQAGGRVRLVPGPARNLKVTTADDLALAAFYLEKREQ
jgi:2-C-methyl-D-erythritol 4-phosphate cytidylyltransferase